jgi:hypothetical protein
MRKFVLASAGATAAALMASPAMAGPVVPACGTAPVSTYTATGYSCSVDSGAIVFSNIAVTPTTSNGGVVTLGDFIPFNSGNEWGLTLTYAANTGTSSSQADVAWTYNVSSAPPMVDAYMAFTGSVTGTGSIALTETLSNGTTLTLTNAGSTTADFSPVSNLFVIKDQNDFSGSNGSAESSILSDGFSLATTPIPGTLPLLAGGLIGLFAIRKRRKRGQTGGRLDSALA